MKRRARHDLQRRLERLEWQTADPDDETWRVDVEEGRPTLIPRLSDEEVARLAAEWYERNPPRGRLVARGDGNFNWSPH
jgi:hypothetical protein